MPTKEIWKQRQHYIAAVLRSVVIKGSTEIEQQQEVTEVYLKRTYVFMSV